MCMGCKEKKDCMNLASQINSVLPKLIGRQITDAKLRLLTPTSLPSLESLRPKGGVLKRDTTPQCS